MLAGEYAGVDAWKLKKGKTTYRWGINEPLWEGKGCQRLEAELQERQRRASPGASPGLARPASPVCHCSRLLTSSLCCLSALNWACDSSACITYGEMAGGPSGKIFAF